MKRRLSLFRVISADILLAGVILLVFAFFHHVLPAVKAAAQPVRPIAAPEITVPAQSVSTPVPKAEAETGAENAVEAVVEDTRSEWQKKFAGHFSSEIIKTENSYTSPNVSITIDTVRTQNDHGDPLCYYVADIYIGDISCFTTHTPGGELKYFLTDAIENMDAQADAILSIGGDFMSYQSTGFLMRNGQLYANDYAYCDICVLFSDGTMQCFSRGTYNNQDLIDAGAVQVWNFGPSLLDENGQVKSRYEVSTSVGYANPRSSVGYYEPGHYCFVVVDGRQEASVGMTIPELAQVFADLGCTCAYNLDGGGSAVMMFEHERYSMQSNGADRDLGDILVIRESEAK